MASSAAMRLRPLGQSMISSSLNRIAKTSSVRISQILQEYPYQSLPGRSSFSSAPQPEAAAAADDDSATRNSKKDPHVAVRLGKHDEHHEEIKRRRLSEVPISDVLAAKHSMRWVDPVIDISATVRQVVEICIEGGLSGMMVVDKNRRVMGLSTSRDLLRIISAGLKDGDSADQVLDTKVSDFMTPISQVVYGRPDETVGMCRTIMAKLGIKCLPILSKEGQVEGLITARDMSDFGLEAKDRGGKTSFLRDVSERVGLGANTSMAEPPAYLQAHVNLEQKQKPLYVNVGAAELPHPFKTPDGCGMNHRDFGAQEFPTDPELSEDAHFVTTVELPDASGKRQDATFMGVADGVGSWREYGVDPREFSHKLMSECESILHEASTTGPAALGLNLEKFRHLVTPAEVMAQAYERVKGHDIIGSCTACVALFDSAHHQFHFSNLGDSGVIVLRHIDSDIAGALKRDRSTPRDKRTSDMRVAFVSQQQLISFNHPFQLGWTGHDMQDEEKSSFKSAADSCTTSIHVRRGDIIIMATDGLFDNVDVDDIAAIALDWEQQNGFIRGGDIVAREKRWAMGNSLSALSAETVGDLGAALCQKARENSLDSSVDSPFACLAKENDIMWSGGMPDDCTVVAVHVVGRRADDFMDKTNQ